MGLLAALNPWSRANAQVATPSASTDFQGTKWRGASNTLRSLQSWFTSIGSGVTDLTTSEQRTLRARSRDAMRNHMIARAALTRCRTNIVGSGLMCRPSIDHETLGLTPEQAETINTQLRSSWERWAEDPIECDFEATLDIYGLQALTLLSAMASGDLFILTPQALRTGGVSEIKLQLIEADRVSNPFDEINTPTRIDGIEIRDGMPVGCWIRNTHPGDLWISMIMPAWTYYDFFGAATGRRRVLHIWNDKERPGQVRGAPFLAPILEPLKQIERYGNAELMAAVLSAMLTVFIQHDIDQSDPNGNPLPAFAGTDHNGNVALGNGAVVDLAPGETANPVNPLRPNPNFDPFFMAIVKQIGAALELPLDELLLHYQSSYSAARAAMLQAWRFYITRRGALAQQMMQPIYGLHLDEEVASGRIALPGYGDAIRRRAYSRAQWIGPARGAMDELKEAQAAGMRIAIGVSNEAIETASMVGEDWHAVYAQRVREVNQRKADGTYMPVPGNLTFKDPAHNEDPAQDTAPKPNKAAA